MAKLHILNKNSLLDDKELIDSLLENGFVLNSYLNAYCLEDTKYKFSITVYNSLKVEISYLSTITKCNLSNTKDLAEKIDSVEISRFGATAKYQFSSTEDLAEKVSSIINSIRHGTT